MSMTTNDRSLFWQRTRDWFDALKRQARAIGTCPTYRLEDLRDLVERYLVKPRCPYCQGIITVATMMLISRTPFARRGRFTLRNLEVCCPECYILRGLLDAQEYRELRLLVGTWPRPVQKRFFTSLKASQAMAQAPLPRCGSLEWFTAADQAHVPAGTDDRGYKSVHLSGAPNHEMPHG
jgi:hypothetical protein